MKLSNEQIIAMLQDFQKTHSRSPVKRDFKHISSTISGRFGSWNKALIAANLPTKQESHKKQLVVCLSCNKEFLKRYCEIIKSNNHFCSRSCAATFNNKIAIKRQRKNTCMDCGCLITKNRFRCLDCKNKNQETIANKTINDVILINQSSNRYARIREHARRCYKYIKSCENCGYSKHVEICHIKPIHSFPINTLVTVVNSKENILILCRNCHWELDHPE